MNFELSKWQRMTFSAFLGCSLFFGASVWAGIIDPNFLLEKTDIFVNGQNFETAFVNGSSIDYGLTECLGTNNCKKEVNWTAIIEAISANEIQVKHSVNGTVKARDKVSSDQWETISRNYLRGRVNNIAGLGYQVSMQSFEPVACPAALFTTTDIQCARVNFFAINSMNQTSLFDYVLSNSPFALAQVVAYEQKDVSAITRIFKYQLKAIYR